MKDAFDHIFALFEAVIYIEDDIVVAPDFLDFMEDCLEKLRTDNRIFSICGYTPKVLEGKDIKDDLVLIGLFTAWGIGLWRDRWEMVDYKKRDYHKDNALMEGFKEYGYNLPNLLMAEEIDILDTWDVQVMLASFRFSMYTAYPRIPKCTNIGKYGVHSKDRYDGEDRPFYKNVDVWEWHIENLTVEKRLNDYMKSAATSYDSYMDWKSSRPYWKYLAYNYVLKSIIRHKCEGIAIDGFFIENSIKKILIYGFTDVGEILCNELSNSSIKVLGYIDRNPELIGKRKNGIRIYSQPDEVEERCDAIIVTPLTDSYEIQEYLAQYIDARKIFTIAEILR